MELIDYELNFISGLSTNMKEVLCVMELIKCKEFELWKLIGILLVDSASEKIL